MHPHNPNDPFDQVDDEPLGVAQIILVATTAVALAAGLVMSVAQAFGG